MRGARLVGAILYSRIIVTYTFKKSTITNTPFSKNQNCFSPSIIISFCINTCKFASAELNFVLVMLKNAAFLRCDVNIWKMLWQKVVEISKYNSFCQLKAYYKGCSSIWVSCINGDLLFIYRNLSLIDCFDVCFVDPEVCWADNGVPCLYRCNVSADNGVDMLPIRQRSRIHEWFCGGNWRRHVRRRSRCWHPQSARRTACKSSSSSS